MGRAWPRHGHGVGPLDVHALTSLSAVPAHTVVHVCSIKAPIAWEFHHLPSLSLNSARCSYAALTYFILCYVSLEHDVCIRMELSRTK